jgi:hypothetical protein
MSPSRPELYTKHGLDWDLIRKEYMNKCSPEEAQRQVESLNRPMRELIKKEPGYTRSKGAGTWSNGVSDEQHRMMVDLYGLGNNVPFISEQMGISQQTVRKHLRDEGVYEPNRDRGKK